MKTYDGNERGWKKAKSLCGDHVLNFVLSFSFQLQRGGGGKEQERAKRREGGEGTRKRTPRTLRNTQRTVWRACILVRVWRVKASFYLLNSFVSLPLPKEITCTKWSVSTKGTLSRRTPNLLLKLPKIWPKSMWNNCNQNKNAVSKITV